MNQFLLNKFSEVYHQSYKEFCKQIGPDIVTTDQVFGYWVASQMAGLQISVIKARAMVLVLLMVSLIEGLAIIFLWTR